MKKVKKILLGIFVFIIASAAATVLTFEFYIKPKYSDALVNAAEDFLKSQESQDEIAAVLAQTEVKAENNDEESSTSDNNGEKMGNSVSDKNTPAGKTENQSTQQAPENTPQPESSSKTSTQSYSKRIDEVKSQIAPKDLADGMRIASKIDIGYLSGLAGGGLTQEEKTEAYNYLRQHLSESEYQRLKNLIYKYMYLLK
ncbi:MAG: hypothetical protein N2171_04120 [Clostridia bacterium]|nr:hypothetical protein [Clostridia bacterium]